MRPHLLNQHLHRRQQQRVFVLLCFAYIYTKDSNTLTKNSRTTFFAYTHWPKTAGQLSLLTPTDQKQPDNFLCLHPLTKNSRTTFFAYTHWPKTAGQLSLLTPTDQRQPDNFLCLHPLTKDNRTTFFAYTYIDQRQQQLSLPTTTHQRQQQLCLHPLTKDSRTTFFAYTYTDQRQPNNLIIGYFYPFQNTSVSVSGVAGLCVALPGKVASATMGACRAAQWVSLCEAGVVLRWSVCSYWQFSEQIGSSKLENAKKVIKQESLLLPLVNNTPSPPPLPKLLSRAIRGNCEFVFPLRRTL